MSQRPALFIGSSVEGLEVAYAVQENLEFDCEPTVWPQGVFRASSAALIDLYLVTRSAEFAVFIFSPGDVIEMRGQRQPAVRDNVIFELGLFVGALGPQRCFFVVPHDADLHSPSDLIGIEPLRYVADRRDGNLRAALGPACNRIRNALRAAPPTLPTASTSAKEVETPVQLAQRLIAEWNSEPLLNYRALLRAGIPLNTADDDTGASTSAMTAVFQFLNSVADGVLSGQVDSALAEDTFFESMISMWERSFTYFVPPGNDPAEAWSPVPQIGVLAVKWANQRT